MNLVVHISNSNKIDIQLFDHPAIKKWFDYFKNLNRNYNGHLRSIPNTVRYNNNIHKKYWDIIADTIAKLKDIGLVYPDVLPDNFDKDQQTLNRLHRFFTANDKWGINYDDAMHTEMPLPKNPINSNFVMPAGMSYLEWHNAIEKINSSVHSLEITTQTNTKLFISNNLPLKNYIIHQPDYNFNNWLSFDDDDQLLNYNYFDYDLPLVLLDNSILGKCVLQSFYEEDDLNAQDCTGRLGSFGGFQFDLTANRKKIYQSEMFKNWIAKHNRSFESIPFEFPIGYIKNFDDVISWLTQSSTIKKVDFVN